MTDSSTETIGAFDPTDQPETTGDERVRRTLGPTPTLLIGALSVALVRWLLAITHRTFTIYFDEPAQLATARTVAGGATWRLFDAPTWQPGFGILLAPLYILVDDAATIYRLAVGVNALLGGVAFVLLTLVGCELTGRKITECALPAAAISLLPAGIVASAYVWSEQLLIVVALATMLAALRFIRMPSLAPALACIGLSAYGYLVHGRLLPLIAISTLLVGVVFARGRHWRDLALSIGFAGAGFAVVAAISTAIQDRLWTAPQDQNTVGATLSRFRSPLSILDAAAGQLWYVVIASLGFAAFGAIAVWRMWADAERRTTAVVVLAYLLPTLALSALFMSNRTIRSDMLIYGRYNEAFIGPVLLVGWFEFVRVFETSRRTALTTLGAIIAVGGGLTLVVHLLHGRELREGEPFLLMVPALTALDFEPAMRVTVPAVTALSVMLMLAGLAYISGPRSRAVTLAAAFIVSIGVLRVGTTITLAPDAELATEELNLMTSHVPAGETIVLRVIPADQSILYRPAKQRTRLQQYQFLVPSQSFAIDIVGDHPSKYVLAPELTTSLATSDATVLWDDPNSPMALWYIP